MDEAGQQDARSGEGGDGSADRSRAPIPPNEDLARFGLAWLTAALNDWWKMWRRRRNPDRGVAPFMSAAARGREGRLPEAVRTWLEAHDLEVPVDREGWGRCLSTWRQEQLLQRRLRLSPATLGPTAARQHLAPHWTLGRR
eukprot:7990811-Alexandrium_andersonii.AAC.1